jgi:hypothetical protein
MKKGKGKKRGGGGGLSACRRSGCGPILIYLSPFIPPGLLPFAPRFRKESLRGGQIVISGCSRIVCWERPTSGYLMSSSPTVYILYRVGMTGSTDVRLELFFYTIYRPYFHGRWIRFCIGIFDVFLAGGRNTYLAIPALGLRLGLWLILLRLSKVQRCLGLV